MRSKRVHPYFYPDIHPRAGLHAETRAMHECLHASSFTQKHVHVCAQERRQNIQRGESLCFSASIADAHHRLPSLPLIPPPTPPHPSCSASCCRPREEWYLGQATRGWSSLMLLTLSSSSLGVPRSTFRVFFLCVRVSVYVHVNTHACMKIWI